MKIIFLTYMYPPDCLGGGAFSTHILAKALQQAGQDILVISTTQNKSQDQKKEIYEGVDVFFVFVKFNYKLRNIYGLYNNKVINILKSKFQEFKPDVIHGHLVSSDISFYSLVLARKFTQAVFFTARDMMALTYGKYWWFINNKNLAIPERFDYHIRTSDLVKQARKSYLPGRSLLIRYWLNNHCAKIFTVSQELKKVFLSNGFKNIEVVYNSVDTNDYDNINNDDINSLKTEYQLQDKKIIFCAGRMSTLKGLVQALEALARIIKEEPQAVLAIAAKEKFNKSTNELVKKLGLEKNIVQFGWLDPRKTKVAFKAAHICLVPSICLDAFPRANLEAMAAKKPVVGTCFGGTPEIVVDNVTGYIVNPLNTEMMAKKIIDLLKNHQRAWQFGEAGYAKVKKEFNPEKQARISLEYYRKFI